MRSLRLGTILGAGMMSCLVSVPFAPPVVSEVMIGVGISGALMSAIAVAASVEYHSLRGQFMQRLVESRLSFLGQLLPTLRTGELKDLCLYLVLRYSWDSNPLSFEQFASTSLSKVRSLEVLHDRGCLSIEDYKEEVNRIFSAYPQQLATIRSLISRYEEVGE